MTHPASAQAGPARRAVVATAGVCGLATLLAACGGSDGKKENAQDGEKGGGAAQPGAGAALGRAADIPEGGGKVFPDRKVVVTQPSKGEFKAFSAVCTHQGCLVKEVADGTINCPCHDSRFSVTDGSVRGGPARQPLPARKVSVNGDSLTLG
ncbi:Rieske (2Fe-2S) protein [Streptomyces griseocarneus]|uniref:Rieske (2Fe-2S) protein n=1 Tax=Streptomyces griseocarneus TaxID=51201 RepID=UPI00167D7188|nr:Rieske (2Fe-2S) protein [Streptomyces griseocarneus]MBZ6476363.1 Rieske (2Fe-2S) protein [Streptomyces griseocarneus]GHG77985.1 iron-sulfur protein [Streptomyces griseocarneus]